MTAHARMIKKTLGADTQVVFIGPCISKKEEAETSEESADFAITFDELQKWLEAEGISLDTSDLGFNEKTENNAELFPLSGGILKTMREKIPDVFYTSVNGIDKCRDVLEELASGKLNGYFIEMSACDGSCLNGPCMPKPEIGMLEAEKRLCRYAGRTKDGEDNTPVLNDIEIDLKCEFTPRPILSNLPGEKDIQDILARTGKISKSDELNCGACGYSTCRQKAIAVYQGKAELAMCMPYMRERAEYISDNVIAFTPNAIIVLDEHLNIQAVNQAACDLFELKDMKRYSGTYIGELMDPAVFEESVVRRQNILNRENYLYRYEKYVEQSVVYVEKHNIVFGIFKDLTEVKAQQQRIENVTLETIETADQVINKQMRIVQEIAMLLGESTADTKIALTKLKDTLITKEG
jgi:uncharacterized Fe-S cluster-containing protein